jgi:FkbM family methyltransferase
MATLSSSCIRMLLKTYAAVNHCVPMRLLSVVPGVSRVHTRVRSFLARHLLPQRSEWVQVQSGFAKGLWIEIDLATERNWYNGNHEGAIQRALQQFVRAETVMYDIGAHLGFHTLPAARIGAHVIAFEADPENGQRLRRNIDRNCLREKARVVEAAVWSTGHTVVGFRRGEPRSQGGVCWGDHQPVLASGEIIEVPACSLDEFAANGGPTPDLIKVDVEGAESEVLKGAARILAVCRPALIVEVHTPSEYSAVTKIVESSSYIAHWEIPPEGFPRQCFAVASSSQEPPWVSADQREPQVLASK